MGRILAIDFGKKRVGLAVTDPMQMIATALTTVDNAKALDYIVEYVKSNGVEKIIIGYPSDLQGKPTHATPYVDKFINTISKKLPEMEIIKWDESFTSIMAVRTLIESGVKKKQRRNKALIDSVAATIILQEYLQNI